MFPNLETHASFVVFREGLMESESEKSLLLFLLVFSIPVTRFWGSGDLTGTAPNF